MFLFSHTNTVYHSLTQFTMLEKWKRGIDNGAYVSALFMDLSRAFDDTINHDLMLVKLKAHGFSTNALNVTYRKFELITYLASLERNIPS